LVSIFTLPTQVAYRHHNSRADGINGFKPATFQWIFDVRKQKENAKCKVLTVSRMQKSFRVPVIQQMTEDMIAMIIFIIPKQDGTSHVAAVCF
jgi:hypothetical protein